MRFWLWVLVAPVTFNVLAEPKLIGDEVSPESGGYELTLPPRKSIRTEAPEPGDLADPFTVPTLDGEFSYQPGARRGHLIIHAYTNKSGFLECLWTSESSVRSLVEGLPGSTQVLVLSLDDSALDDVTWMREQVQRVARDRYGPGVERAGVVESPADTWVNLLTC